MLFNTLEYFAFFIIVLTVAWGTAQFGRLRTLLLLAASIYFYASNNSWQTLLLLFTTTVDYCVCLQLAKCEDEKSRRRLVSISIVSNLGLLAWFKYANFLGHSATNFAALFGIKLDWITLNVVLPVGISFYTFEALSYTIDVYRRKIPAERDWSRLAFLVTFFPHLISGPIIRAADFFPQIGRRPSLTRGELERALFLLAGGLLKKIVLADNLAPYSDAAFDTPGGVGTVQAWLGFYAFAFQIYFDFSGYTDIAIGCASLLGFVLPDNFRRPYAAQSITEFWRRWHISLSTWLRDYLYIPLGGNKMSSPAGVYRNLMLTMLLGGLWHGAAWTFVCWGAMHGLYLSLERALGFGRQEQRGEKGVGYQLLAALLTFHVVAITWIPFRAANLHLMKQLLIAMFSGVPGAKLSIGAILFSLVMAVSWFWQFMGERVNFYNFWSTRKVPIRAVAYAAIGILVFVIGSGVPKSFIYFRF